MNLSFVRSLTCSFVFTLSFGCALNIYEFLHTPLLRLSFSFSLTFFPFFPLPCSRYHSLTHTHHHSIDTLKYAHFLCLFWCCLMLMLMLGLTSATHLHTHIPYIRLHSLSRSVDMCMKLSQQKFFSSLQPCERVCVYFLLYFGIDTYRYQEKRVTYMNTRAMSSIRLMWYDIIYMFIYISACIYEPKALIYISSEK